MNLVSQMTQERFFWYVRVVIGQISINCSSQIINRSAWTAFFAEHSVEVGVLTLMKIKRFGKPLFSSSSSFATVSTLAAVGTIEPTITSNVVRNWCSLVTLQNVGEINGYIITIFSIDLFSTTIIHIILTPDKSRIRIYPYVQEYEVTFVKYLFYLAHRLESRQGQLRSVATPRYKLISTPSEHDSDTCHLRDEHNTSQGHAIRTIQHHSSLSHRVNYVQSDMFLQSEW